MSNSLKGNALEFYHRSDQSIKSLIEMGVRGFFPLFEKEWISEIAENSKKLTGNDKLKAKQLFKKICQYPSLQRKKTVLMALKQSERDLFICAFMKMVESKILDRNPEFQ